MTSLLSVAARGLSAAVGLLAVPLTISYLGTERYGLWLTVSSLVAMMSFADLGIGNGLTTHIAEAQGRDDKRTLSRLTSSAVVMLTIVAVLLITALLILGPIVDWNRILSITNNVARGETAGVVMVLGLTFFCAMPFAVVQRAQSGLQQGYSTVLWSAAGTLVSLVLLLVATRLRVGLVGLVLALSGAPLFAAMLNSLWFFGWKRPDLRPSLGAVDPRLAWNLLRTGALFVLLQLAVSFAFASDNVVIGATLGAAAVPLLALPAKLFNLVLELIGTFVAPLWPAFGEAAARGDVTWVRRTLRRAHAAVILTAVSASAVLFIAGPWIIERWSRGRVTVGRDVLLPLAVWTLFAAWGTTASAFLNGVKRIAAQAGTAVVMAAAAFGLKWMLVKSLGLPGVVWATIVAYFLCSVGPLWWTQRRVLARLVNNQSRPTSGG